MSSSQNFAEKVYDKLAGLLTDMTTLTVETRTLDTQGNPTVRARTEVSLDGDMVNDLPTGSDGRIDEALLAQHQKSVAQARAERQSLVDTMMKIVQGRLEVEKAEVQ